MRLYLLNLIFLALSMATFAQTEVTGTVKDPQTGEALIGATVVIEGTTQGTTTDIDGNFKFETEKTPPFNLKVSFIGYQPQVVEYTGKEKKLKIEMSPSEEMLETVVVVGDRISEKQKQEPLTVERMDIIAIKETPSGNFYEGLANMKGVDMTSASLGFKVINTRGFNSTSPVRSLQLIDGVDNQSPGLNFSLGNFLGSSDLDVMSVDVIAGASSAFYGPGAFNGVINMTTKDPFDFPGLAVSAKVGERNLHEYAARWAQVFENKEGKPKFAYKLNIFYMQAQDWEADNLAAVDDTELSEDNPGGYDAVNVYGDEKTNIGGNEYDRPTDYAGQNQGIGSFRRTGYQEVDLADYGTQNLKLNAAFHYRITDSVEAIIASSYSYGTTIYQGENRFSLRDIQFLQNRLEFRKKDKWFIRAYSTNEDAGNSYDIVTTAQRMQEAANDEADWNSEYFSYFNSRFSRQLRQQEDFPTLDLSNLPPPDQPDARREFFENWAETEYAAWYAANFDLITQMHQQTRQHTDSALSPSTEGIPRFLPGTARFDSLFNDVTGRTLGAQGGSGFYDRSALYNIQGEYIFRPGSFDITVGGNGRLYMPDSRGTIFSDTLTYERVQTDSGVLLTDSSYTRITNYQYGFYAGVQKAFLDEKLISTFTLRVDKNENFDFLFSPAFSLVYTHAKKHTFRATFTSGNRNPTLADQYLFYDVGRATLLGNLEGYDSLLTSESIVSYLNTFSPDSLEYFDVDPIRPEQVRTVEFGYRGFFFNKLYIDASAYYSWYQDFIGFLFGVDSEFDINGNIKNTEVYRIAANAESQVTTQGVTVGVNYYLNDNYVLNGNYSFNELTTGEDDPLVPAFNTPRHKYNLGFTGRDIRIRFIKTGVFGFGVNYKWIEGFRFEGSPQFTGNIDSYDLVDAQVNYTIPKWHTMFKVGASNILNNEVFQVYGGPRVGRLAYISIVYDWRNQRN